MEKVEASEITKPAETQRRRVLFVLPSLVGGGAERVMVVVLRHLDRSRFEPHLAVVNKKGPYLSDIPEDVPIHDLGGGRVRYASPALLRLVWRLRPQAILSTLREVNLAVLVLKPLFPRGVKLIVREGIAVSADLDSGSQRQGFSRWLYRHYYAAADKIICVAEYVRKDLAEQFAIPLEKMVTIYSPADVQRIRELATANPNPYTGAGPHLVAAGRLSKQKGFDVLLDALALVRRTILAQLTILGEGPLEAELKAQAQKLGLLDSVCFAGFQTNPYPFFKHADLFVLSSRYEGLPVVLLEALSLGTPVVATDAPGGAGEILAGCSMGLLVPRSNAPALAQGIISALQSRAENPSSVDNLEGTLDKFRVERVMKQYEDLL
jgi:glycosyltransferase involved in cell wall biosynthesis